MRVFVVGLIGLVLAGCVSVANTLRPDQVASFRLAGVEVVTSPAARIRWGDGEVAYAATRGVAPQDTDSVASTPEAQAYLRQGVSTRLKAALERELSGSLVGTRPVRLRVTLQVVDIAPPLQRIVLGGSHSLKADIVLVDAKTGAVVSQYPGQVAVAFAGNGIGGTLLDAAFLDAPIDRVTASYASRYRQWLFAV